MNYDVIVIGGGTAGLAAYRKAKSLGKKALIIEANDFVTTCANVGCMPSKLLIAAAESMHNINKAKEFGIEIKEITLNDEKLWGRIRFERDRFVSFVKKGANNISVEDKIIGYATITSPNTVLVNGENLHTQSIVIATGSRPFIPPLFSEIKEEILTNENVFELTNTPKSIAVFGAGVIGLELGFAFKNLGAEIFLFNRGDQLLKLNKDINDYLVNHLKESMTFIYEEEVIKILKKENGYQIFYGEKSIFVEKILVATGRIPNLDNIGLDNVTNLKSSDILKTYSNQTTQILNTSIFLAGDVNNEVTLLHEATKEGNIAGENAANYPHVESFKRNVFMGVIFSDPQIMQIGKTTNLPNDIIKGQVSFEDQGRSRVMLKNKGLLNVYFDRGTHLLIGAEMIGPDAEHIAHSLAWLIEKNTTLEEILELPFYHPVIEEGVRTAMRDAINKV